MCRYVHNNSNSESSDHTSSETTLHHLQIKKQDLKLSKAYLESEGGDMTSVFSLNSKKGMHDLLILSAFLRIFLNADFFISQLYTYKSFQ